MSGPAFTVVVPTYNRPGALAECVAALAALEFPEGGFEVVVVDDGSPSPVDSAVQPFFKKVPLRVLRQENRGPAIARNAGAVAARGRFLAFTDDDCRPERRWLVELQAMLSENPGALVGGHTVNATNLACSAASQVVQDAVYAFYNHDPLRARFFASNNLAADAASFREAGGFAEDFFRHASKDRELCDRWRHRGGRLVYAPEAAAQHAHALDLSRFVRQHFTYGQGAWHYQRLRARRGSGRLLDDLGFHRRLPALLREPLGRLGRRRAAQVMPLLGVWQAANAAGFFYEALRERVRGTEVSAGDGD